MEAAGAAEGADTPLPPTPPTPTSVKRVGGGFEYNQSLRYTDAAEARAAYELYRALPADGVPLTAVEVRVLADILCEAEEAARTARHAGALTLSQVLAAYSRVLRGLGIAPESDTTFYRMLLRLSLDREEEDWWGRLFREVASNSRRHGVPPEQCQALFDVLLSCRMGTLNCGNEGAAEWVAAVTASLPATPAEPVCTALPAPGQQVGQSPHCAGYHKDGPPAWQEHAGVAVQGGTHKLVEAGPAQLPEARLFAFNRPVSTAMAPAGPLELAPSTTFLQQATQPLLWSKYPLIMPPSPCGQSVWSAPADSGISPASSPRISPFLPFAQAADAVPQPEQLAQQPRRQQALQLARPPVQQPTVGIQAALLRMCLQGWHRHIIEQIRNQADEVTGIAQRQLSRCLWRWHLLARVAAEAHVKAAQRRSTRLLATGFQALRLQCTTGKTKGLQVQLALQHWQCRLLRECLRMWQAATANTRCQATRADSHFAARRRQIVLREWSAASARCALLHQCGAILAGRVAQTAVRSLLLAWLRVATRRSRNENVLATCVARMQHRSLAACLCTWRSMVAKRALARRFAAHLCFRHAALCVRQWRWRAESSTAQRAVLAASVQRMQQWRLAAALGLWRSRAVHWASRREQLSAAVCAMATSKLRAAWTAWKERGAMWSLKRELLARCLVRMQQVKLRSALSAWQHHAAAQLEAKSKCQHCISVLRHGAMARAWKSWLERVEQQRQKRGILLACVARLHQGILVRCLHAWRAAIVEHQRLHALGVACILRLRQGVTARALSKWRSWLAVQRAAAGKLERAVAIIRCRLLRASFSSWAEHASAMSTKRALLQRAVAVMASVRVHTAFAAWRAWAPVQRCRQEKIRAAAAAFCFRRERAVLGTWVAWTAERQHERERLERAVRALRSRLLYSAFLAWQAWVAQRQQDGNQVAVAIMAWKASRLRAAFATWVDRVRLWQGSRQRLAAALVAMELMALARAWRTWRAFVGEAAQERQQLQRTVLWWKQHILAKTFRTWQNRCQQRRHQSTCLARALACFKNQRLHASWVAWMDFLDGQRRKRLVLAAATTRLLNTCLSCAWTAWRQFIADRAQAAARMQVAVGRFCQWCMAAAFGTWRQLMLIRRAKSAKLARAVCLWRHTTQGACLSQWRVAARLRRRLRDAARLVVARLVNRQLSAAIDAWRDFHACRKRRRHALQQAAAHWMDCYLRAGLAAFAHNVARMHRARAALGRCRQAAAAKALTAWQRTVAQQRWQADSLLTIARRFHQPLLAEAWASWGEAVEEQRLLREQLAAAVAHWCNKAVAAAFRTWRHQVWKEHALAKAAGFFADCVVRRAFNAWVDFAAYRSELAAKAKHALDRWRAGCLGTAFGAWRAAVRRRQYQRQVLAAAAACLHSRTVACAFAGWRSRLAESLERTAKLEQAVQLWQGCVLRTCFQCWQEHAAELRLEVGMLASAVALWRSTRLAAAWAAWAAHHARRQCARAVVLRFQHRSLAMAFGAWRDSRRQRQELGAILGSCLDRWRHARLTDAWAFWRMWTVDKQGRRGRLQAAVQRWERSTLTCAFAGWRVRTTQQQERCAKMQVSLQKLLNQRLLAAFAAFRENVANQKLKRHTLQHFASTTLLRAWNAWASYLQDRQAEAAKLQVAVQRWQQATLRAAFQYFVEAAASLKRARHMAARAIGYFAHVRLCAAWSAWKQRAAYVADQQRRVSGCVARLMHRQMAAAWATWAAAVELRHMKCAASASWQRKLLLRCFHALQQPLKEQAVARACLARLMHRQMASAFASWAELVIARRHARQRAVELGNRAVARLAHRSLAAALASWRELAARNQRLRHILRRIQYHSTAAALQAWRQRTATMLQARALMRRTFLNTQQYAFSAWRDAAEATGHDRRAVEQAAVAQERGTPKRLVYALQGREDLAAMVAALGAWRAAVQQNHRLRVQVVAAFKHLYLATARRCFDILRSHAYFQTRARQAVAAFAGGLLRKAWRKWREHARREANAASQLSAALSLWSGNRTAAAWAAWTAFVQLRVRRREAGTDATTHYCQHLRRAALVALGVWAARRRGQHWLEHRVEGHMAGWRLALIFGSWQRAAARQATVRQAVARLRSQARIGQLRLAFDGWRWQARQKAYQRQLIRMLWLRRCCAPIFISWREAATNNLRAAQHFVCRTSAQVLAAWRDQVRWSTLARRKLAACLDRMQQYRAASAFAKWVEWARERQQLKAQLASLLLRTQRHVLVASLAGWREAVRERGERRAMVHEAAARLRHGLLLRAFARWVKCAGEHVQRSELLRRAVDYFAAAELRRNWDQWRDSCIQARAEAVAQRQHVRIMQLKVWVAWHAHMMSERNLRAKARSVVLKLRNVLLAAAFRSWSEHTARCVDLRNKAQLLVDCIVQRHLCAAWSAWRGHTQRRRHVARAACQALLRRSGMTLAKGFGRWQAVASELRRRRHLLRHAVASLAERQLLGAFTAWRQRATWHARSRQLLQAAAVRLGMHHVSVVFAAWKAHAERRSLLRRLQAGALKHLQEQRARAALASWHCLATKARRVVLAMQHRVLRAALASWAAAVAEQRLSLAAAQHALSVQRRTWTTWCSFVLLSQHKRRRVQKAAVACFASTRLRAWRAWRQHWRAVLQKERAYHAHRTKLLGRCLRAWRRAVDLCRRQVQLVLAARRRTMQGVLVEWSWVARADHFFRRYYLSRGMASWMEHMAKLQQLRACVAYLSNATLMRTWAAWRGLAATMGQRRTAFVRKQAAVKRAIEFGDAIARARRAELIQAFFAAWRMRARVGQVVQQRLEQHLRGSLQAALSGWRQFHEFKVWRRHQAALVYQWQTAWVQRRALRTWRDVLAAGAQHEAQKLQLAAAHAFSSQLRGAFMRWEVYLQRARLRRQRLAALLASLCSAGPSAVWCFSSWREQALRSRQAAARAEELAARFATRLAGNMFEVWRTFARAMRADIDPNSPFLAPRGQGSDEALIWDVAEIAAGHTSSTSSSAGSSTAGAPGMAAGRATSDTRGRQWPGASPEAAEQSDAAGHRHGGPWGLRRVSKRLFGGQRR